MCTTSVKYSYWNSCHKNARGLWKMDLHDTEGEKHFNYNQATEQR